MTEPEVSLRVAMHYIQNGLTSENVKVSIDGAHIMIKEKMQFDIVGFLRENGYEKLENGDFWRGEYKNEKYLPCIEVSSDNKNGDVRVRLNNGSLVYVESKKFKSGNSGEYPAMHEAIGQVVTGCPKGAIPIVAVPYNDQSKKLSDKWIENENIKALGICFALVCENGKVKMIGNGAK